MPNNTLGGVQPLTGLKGWINPTPEATPEERLGGTADPRHAKPIANPAPYPYEVFPGEPHGPYGIENQLLGMDIVSYETPAGYIAQDPTGDEQPLTNAAPWPKGVPQSVYPDAVAEQRRVSADIHASNMGQSRRSLYSPSMLSQNDEWTDYYEVEPGTSEQVPIPKQIQTGVGGFGSTDRIQSTARQNQYGFDSAHSHRRYATGKIPGNRMWMEPGGRPMVKTIPGTANVPVGQDSPFAGQDPTSSFGIQGSVLQTLPTQYEAPPDPALANSYAGDSADAEVSWF